MRANQPLVDIETARPIAPARLLGKALRKSAFVGGSGRFVVGISVVAAWIAAGLLDPGSARAGSLVECASSRGCDGGVPESGGLAAGGDCTNGLAYWLSHESAWLIDGELCGASWMAILENPTQDDAFLSVAKQRIMTALNVAGGASTPPEVVDAYVDLEGAIADCAISEEENAAGLGAKNTLEQYNDGVIGPGQCQGQVTCSAVRVTPCVGVASAAFFYSERVAGRESMKVKLNGVKQETSPGDFGDPVGGDGSLALCLYGDDGLLLNEFLPLPGGETCGGQPCWAPAGAGGYKYSDAEARADGVAAAALKAGDAGRGKIVIRGKNNASKGQAELPTGLIAALAGTTSPQLQILSSSGLCIGATLDRVGPEVGSIFRASKR